MEIFCIKCKEKNEWYMTYWYCHDCYSAMMGKLQDLTFPKVTQSTSHLPEKDNTVCTNCNWKWYNSVYRWDQIWSPDFPGDKYVLVKQWWIENVKCSVCNWEWCKSNIKSQDKPTTNQQDFWWIDKVVYDLENATTHYNWFVCYWGNCSSFIKTTIMKHLVQTT
jgi:hypothetical protein